MTVMRRPGSAVWHYKFVYQGRRYRGTTGQLDRRDAEAAEAEIKKQVRHTAAGIALDRPTVGPTFQDWAEIYYLDAARKVKRPERIKDLTRVGLRFWGERPAREAPEASRPYHNLRLTDVVEDPSWLLKWEEWLEAPKLEAVRHKQHTPRLVTWSAQTKNQYRSWLSRLFHLALSPAYRRQTGIITNPTLGIWRDATKGRKAVLSVDDILAILSHASYHIRLAVAIGLLAPKLREGNILALEWDVHVALERRTITVTDHKTDDDGAPLVVAVSDQLHDILTEARKRRPLSRFVVTYRGARVHEVRGGLANAIARAAVTRPHLRYGRATPQGITFHTLRHTAATMMVELEVALTKVKDAMGHKRLDTTLLYTHTRPEHETRTMETLSAALPLSALVLDARTRAPGTVASSVATPTKNDTKSLGNTTSDPIARTGTE